ncbi:MAG: HAMP domain-containing sensor histidine kinase [Pseudomonadota bacterium]
MLTIIVVMVVEVAIFVPSVSQFRNAYLMERIARAHIASLSLLAAPTGKVPPELEAELLDNAEVVNIVMQRDGVRQFMLSRDQIPMVDRTFDLRSMPFWDMIADAFNRMTSAPDGQVIRVIGEPPKGGGELIEITLDPAPLRAAMLDYGWRILRLSLIISLITAGGVFFLIRRLVVSPLLNVTDHVIAFRQDPEDPDTTIEPSMRRGEISDAERALSEMQTDVRRALRERARLASLGEALAKISHDLRNILSSQQLMVDRLERSSDPVVARVMPKMIGSLDRAINLCQRTLDFGKAEEPEPEIREVVLREMVEEVAESLGMAEGEPVQAVIDVPRDYTLPADPEQLHRVLTNLMRNASQAIRGTGKPGTVSISVTTGETCEIVCLRDSGPGLPKRALEHLFQPFRGGATRGGSGLGLAIAQELISAHGGRLELVSTTTAGTEFTIRLPRR